MNRFQKRTFGGLCFDSFNVVFLLLFALVTLLPFLHIIAVSLSESHALKAKQFILFPQGFSLDAYRYLFSTEAVPRSLLVTVFVTVAGTLVNLMFTLTMAYALARRDLLGRKPVMMMIIFSMLFSGGMIPTYLLIRDLQMLDTYWALTIPGAISAFNLIIIKNFFQQLPAGLEESAKIDGASDIGVLVRIVLPLSMPVIATFTLFYAVGHWNTFFSAVIYLNDSEKWPVQVILRQMVILSSQLGESDDFSASVLGQMSESIKMSVIVVATLPILLLYPFLQKYFVKGVLLGSIKG
ncbi:carbohydrate ABC transporter permease [Paenibacillus sp. PAMC21692]|uniref:carbohydrate ABC transporter permease n=1 Tax=Paenibacillus sp. PAMC21692 TaxID=2762320 RepID=UPI00164D1BA0|nr:carbohydrate ABC transporter permease [Paenibacillus sp. PAMC21692]QNK57000.1 carbohydrate ABC transporter permease [Paenibacillus sp. PAMC21692]